MDIGGLSMVMSEQRAAQQVDVSLMKKAMDSGDQQKDFIQDMTESMKMQQAAEPHKGSSIDVSL
ncbi:YjfB family protein [Salsuginibacillus kocurii]|uniref:YjfB family protein n=1 Tax=Salsuginibacillus kocurii TaxID=427078 RepID=UPI00036E494D|nr:YjfB family protein [Salsuginibacillus kocurii]